MPYFGTKPADAPLKSSQLPTDVVTADAIAANAVDSSELVNGSVDIAHLSASGTAGSGNFLRGDNSWTAATQFANWSQSSGHLTPDNATYGIHLGVSTATASNLLDDYEEGTFTPTAASNFGGSVSEAEGHYTKIGNVVSIWCHVKLSNDSDGSSCSIGGLPFNATSYTYMHHALSQGYHFSDVVALYPQVTGGANEVFWYTTGVLTGGDVVTYTEMGTNSAAISMSVGGVYKT